MKNKLFLILLIAIMMFGITACANINNNEVVDNNLNNNDVMNEDTNLIDKEPNVSLGKYTLSFNNIDATHEEVGHYYDGLDVRLIGDSKFQIVEPEGIMLSGKYIYENGMLICNADKLYGVRFDETGEFEEEVNYTYFFEVNGDTQLKFIEMKKNSDGSLKQTSHYPGSIYTLDYEGEPVYKNEGNW
ncbi:MAG: hypothetical protein IKK43_06795 [Clostridia bacterium]|nr:hypothetical protein [Clostridia bacterium]